MIGEHREIYGEPAILHNILVGIKGKKEEKYLMENSSAR